MAIDEKARDRIRTESDAALERVERIVRMTPAERAGAVKALEGVVPPPVLRALATTGAQVAYVVVAALADHNPLFASVLRGASDADGTALTRAACEAAMLALIAGSVGVAVVPAEGDRGDVGQAATKFDGGPDGKGH